jgi:hypothetical protein
MAFRVFERFISGVKWGFRAGEVVVGSLSQFPLLSS